MLTGSNWAKTILLTISNLAGVLLGSVLFAKLSPEAKRLKQPASLLAVTLIAFAASVATSTLGAVANAFLFHGGAIRGYFTWLATELAHYIVILPVILTFPNLTKLKAWLARTFSRRPTLQGVAPVVTYLASLMMVPVVGGPGALAFPVPALLWCAMTYGLAITTLLTLSFAVWTLIVLSTIADALAMQMTGWELISLRLGVMLVALAPITVASVMASRNALLREAHNAREAAEEAMAARTLLLATMAHELRSPLTAVVGFSGVMARQTLGPVGNPKYLDYSQSIEMAGSHLADLVSDLLDTAQVEARKIELTPARASSRDIVEQSLRLVRGLAIDAGVRLRMVPGDWPDVQVDQRAIKQVLINLLSNAVKFSPHDSSVEISSELKDGRLIVRVCDHGKGIRKEDLPRLGLPYVQGEDEPSRREGWGLGLSLSRELVEMHGGRLRLESELGVGSTAIFDLPLAAEPA
jgi:signal transduction histidine kinase